MLGKCSKTELYSLHSPNCPGACYVEADLPLAPHQCCGTTGVCCHSRLSPSIFEAKSHCVVLAGLEFGFVAQVGPKLIPSQTQVTKETVSKQCI